MKIIKAPQSIASARHPFIFLAGSIEMGKADEWQKRFEYMVQDLPGTIFNPRRDDWDSSWHQDINNDHFYEQVQWELQALDEADVIAMYFDPNTKSPITLLELGLHADNKGLIVACPDGFYRKGNVDIVCDRYGIPVVKTLDQLVLKSVESAFDGDEMAVRSVFKYIARETYHE
jgi:hypothetical protein